MKKMFVLIQPFDTLQHIEIFDENGIIQTAQITIADIPEQLCLLTKKYDIT